jgi:hypothetical protein
MPNGSIFFVLEEYSRQKLIRAFPPKYADVRLHKFRHKTAATEKDLIACCAKGAKAVGLHEADGLQVLVLEVDGSCHQRTLGHTGDKYYNVILSCDPKKVHPRRADEMITGIVLKGNEASLYNLEKPIDIGVRAQFISIDGKTVITKPREPEPDGPGLLEEAGDGLKHVADKVVHKAEQAKDTVVHAAETVKDKAEQAADGVKQGVRGVLGRLKLFR